MLLALGTARSMTERPDEHRLLTQYLAEIRKKPLLTPAQELALGEQKNAGAKARQQLPVFSAKYPPAHARERAPKSSPGAVLRVGEGG